MHLAAYNGDAEIVATLLQARADVTCRSAGGETALDIAGQRAKEWKIGGGDGEESIEGLSKVISLLESP